MRLIHWIVLSLLMAGCREAPPARDARLQAPGELARAAKKESASRIFVNPRARALLAGEKLAFVSPDARDAAAISDPSIWRKLDRAQRFDAVLLAGPTSEIAPLLRHLADSPDFRIAHLDNWGALFVRGVPEPLHPPAAEDAADRIPKDRGRGLFLAQMALMLDAAGQLAEAKSYLTEAEKIASGDPDVHICAAAFALGRKDYADAVRHAEAALKIRPGDLAALEIEARALSESGAKDAAWQIVTEMKSLAPDSMNVLFLHARLSNGAKAYSAEQDSLEKLIRLAEKQNLPTTDYRIYLGQCFARQGLARPALLQLEEVLKDPSLSSKQREDVTTAVEIVRKKAGILAQ